MGRRWTKRGKLQQVTSLNLRTMKGEAEVLRSQLETYYIKGCKKVVELIKSQIQIREDIYVDLNMNTDKHVRKGCFHRKVIQKRLQLV